MLIPNPNGQDEVVDGFEPTRRDRASCLGRARSRTKPVVSAPSDRADGEASVRF